MGLSYSYPNLQPRRHFPYSLGAIVPSSVLTLTPVLGHNVQNQLDDY